MYALGYLVPVAICLYALTTDFSKAWLVLLGCIVLFAVVDYIVFDAAADKVSWRLFWSKFYASEEERTQNYSSAEMLMKQYEQNPTQANYEQM